MHLEDYDITTASGDVFSGADLARFAYMFFRFNGEVLVTAHTNWNKVVNSKHTLYQYNCFVKAGKLLSQLEQYRESETARLVAIATDYNRRIDLYRMQIASLDEPISK